MPPRVLLVGLAAVALAGCGGPSKEDLALAHVRTLRRPGAIRLVNLTSGDTGLEIEGAKSARDVPPGGKTIYIVAKAGKRKIVVKDGQDSILAQTEVDFKPLEGVSLFVMGKSAFALIEGEPRERTVSDLKLALINLTKAPLDVLASGKPIGTAVPANGLSLVRGPKDGKIAFAASEAGKRASIDGDLALGHSYSLVVYEASGKLTGILVENSPVDPAQTGASGAG